MTMVRVHWPMPIRRCPSRMFRGSVGGCGVGRLWGAIAFARMVRATIVACSRRHIERFVAGMMMVLRRATWKRRSTSVALANLDPLCIFVIVLQKMFPCVSIILKDNPSVPAIVNGPKNSNLFPNHTIGTEPRLRPRNGAVVSKIWIITS